MEAPSAVRSDPYWSASRRGGGKTMDSFVYQPAEFMNNIAAAVRLRRGVLSRPLVIEFYASAASFPAVRARYGRYFERALRMPEPAFTILVDKVRPRLPSRGLSAELRTAMALH